MDYLRIGWAVLVASDPESFGLGGDPAVRANAAFLDSRRGGVQALLHPRAGGSG